MYRIVLLRHGESVWNRENRFTGWTDVDLTDKGREEAREAGRLMAAEKFEFDIAHTSVLALPGIADRVVSVTSLSKSHSMTGWRAGWSIGPVELAEHLVYLAPCMLYGSPGFIQDAAEFALTTPLDEVGEHFSLGLGALGSFYVLPSALGPAYGSSPSSYMLFTRVKLK